MAMDINEELFVTGSADGDMKVNTFLGALEGKSPKGFSSA